MTLENDQLSLFAPKEPAPSRKGPAEVFTLSDVVTGFLRKRGPRACRNCRCTEANPCRLRDGEKCTIDESTGYCSNSQCQAVGMRKAG